MTSRELVVDTLEFRSPPRVPRQLWVLPWAGIHHPSELSRILTRFPDDIETCPSFFRVEPRTMGAEHRPGTFIDEWGCVFENRQEGIIGEVKEPMVREWKDAERVRPPVERLSVDTGRVDDFCRGSGRFVLAGSKARPFEQIQFLRKPENLFMDLADPPDELFRLIERVHGFFKEELELWASTEVDALFFADDWGSQRSLLISPALWRRLFKPLYREYIDIAHRNGKYAFMHTDGFITDIFPDLVEIGLDAVNAQLFCMDIEDLGRRFGGRITFWGEVDRQHILARGTRNEVFAAVDRVRRALDRRGGVIAQCEFGIGACPGNVFSVFEAWENRV
jgi:hypothetical protein